MATVTRRARLTDDERAERRGAEQQLAAAAVAQLRSSDGWQQWLQTRSKFHRYSFGNQMLIAYQHPTASRVAGFRKWLELGYVVRKGQHGIRIWAPCPPSKKQLAAAAAAGEDRPRTFFRLTAVFAQDQVEALPPPAVQAPIDPPIVDVVGDELAPMLPALVELAGSIGSAVAFTRDGLGAAHGCYELDSRRITVSDELSINGQVKTLVHELAHALVRADRQDTDPTLDRAGEELVVESVAMSVCGAMGIDTAGYSIPYLTSWSSGGPELEALITSTAKLVNRLACRIEDATLELAA
jgi:antirestriction protein ArdC